MRSSQGVWVGVAALLVASCNPIRSARADEPEAEYVGRVITARRADMPIAVDGNLDEAVWGRAEVVDGFFAWRGRERVAAYLQTEVRVLWDETHLYVGATMQSTDIYAPFKEDNDTLWRGDVFEIFIKPSESSTHYYELHVAPNSRKLELFIPRRGAGSWERFIFNSGMRTATAVRGEMNNWRTTDEGWAAEMAIPFSAFEETAPPPGAGAQWRVAFCRYDYSVHLPEDRFRRGVEISSSAAFPTGNFHDYEAYDVLLFVEE